MSVLTISLDSLFILRFRSLFLLIFLLAASINCGTKAASPVQTQSNLAAARLESVADVVVLSSNGPHTDFLYQLAPAPQIRVGLSTNAEAVRLTSSKPFLVGAETEWVKTQDVLLEPGIGTGGEGKVFRVQVASFPFRRDALVLSGELRESLQEPVKIAREIGTGRYAVRVGSFGTSEGALTASQVLQRRGYKGLSIVSVPTVRRQPEWVTLALTGRSSLRVRSLLLKAIPSAPESWIEIDGRTYRGFIEIFVNKANLFTIVNVINLEDYLKGVVPAELSPEIYPEEEALKAQAVAARTYAVKRAGQFASEGYDICATAACQVYHGEEAEHELSNQAVNTTGGEILTFDSQPVDALYTSTCGGRTENSENVFSEAMPYLVSRACFAESSFDLITTDNNKPLSLEIELLRSLGILGEEVSSPWLRESVLEREAVAWIEITLRILGQRLCHVKESAGVNKLSSVEFATLLIDALCWKGRLPFLLNGLDSERLVPDDMGFDERSRHALAYMIHAGLFLPQSEGLETRKAMARSQVLETLYRVLERLGSPLLQTATVLRADGTQIILRDENDIEISSHLSSGIAMYSSTSQTVYYQPQLLLMANDEVRFHIGDEGIDILVLATMGGTFDRKSRFSHWTVRISNEDLSRRIGATHPVGTVIDLRPLRFGRSGRIAAIEIVGAKRSVELKGLAIRRALGTRETLFFIDAQRDANGTVQTWVFTGRGWGHGVGLCQVGAFGMAVAGYDYRQILAHYYAGTKLEPLSAVATSNN